MSPRDPYIGIRPFEEEDAPLFFGRERHANDLLRRLEDKRFVAVVESSGSGKSSLVRAGLLPLVKQGFLRGIKRWETISARPGRDPFGNLARDLVERELKAGDPSISALSELDRVIRCGVRESELRRSRHGMAPVLERAMSSPKAHFLVVIDQFEELLGFRSNEPGSSVPRGEVEEFVNLLLQTCAAPVLSPYAIEPETVEPVASRVWVVLTMRSDFIGLCEAFPRLAALISQSQFLVPMLLPDEMEEAVRGPGRLGPPDYAPFECEPGLVQTVIRDCRDRPDQLPLMAHALAATWKLSAGAAGAGDGPRRLRITDYEQTGRIAGALHKDAEAAWDELLKGVEADPRGIWSLPAESTPELVKRRGERVANQAREMFLLLCNFSEEGNLTRRRPKVAEIAAHTAGITCVAYNSDGTRVGLAALMRMLPFLEAPRWIFNPSTNRSRSGSRR